MERTISVRSDRNIRDQLWRWSPFDRSGHLGRSDRNVPFHLTKLLFPVPLFCILLTRTMTKRSVTWIGSVQPECTVPLGTWDFRNLKPIFCWMESAPNYLSSRRIEGYVFHIRPKLPNSYSSYHWSIFHKWPYMVLLLLLKKAYWTVKRCKKGAKRR